MVTLELGDSTIDGVNLVIFDKDGTLMELYHYWSQMIDLRSQLICERLGLDANHRTKINFAMGVDESSGKLRPEGPVGVKRREIVMQAAIDYLASVGHDGAYDLCFDVFEEIDRVSSANLDRLVRPIAGAADLINNLSESNCKIAIATTDKTERATLATGFLGFGDRIDLIVGADRVSKSKPDPEMIFEILKRLDVDKSNAVMVGDAVTDVQMGVNAELKASIGVLSGLAGEVELHQHTPYVIDSVLGINVRNG